MIILAVRLPSRLVLTSIIPLYAFIISFLLGGFGGDWFYLSRGDLTYIVVGIVKLVLIGQAGLCCCTFTFDCCNCKEGIEKCFGPCSCLVSLAVFIWWAADWIRILTNNFPDGNGLELKVDL